MPDLFRAPAARVRTLMWAWPLAFLLLLNLTFARAAEAPTVMVEQVREAEIIRQVPLSGMWCGRRLPA